MISYKKEINNILNSKKSIITENIKDREIILYGAGKMGIMALDFLEKINIKPKFIIDQNITGTLKNIKIISLKDLTIQDKKECLLIICIVTIPYKNIFDSLKDHNCSNICHFYDYSNVMLSKYISNGWEKSELDKNDLENIKNICSKLEEDETSLAHYLQFLWWRIRKIENIYKDYPVLLHNKYFDAPCFPKLTENERLLDAGAHFGTTIQHFINATNKKFETIWAYEPDEQNLTILKNLLNKEFEKRINLYNIALSDKNGSSYFTDKLGFASKIDKEGNIKVSIKRIDSLNINPTIIKLHLEDHELKALNGAKKTIIEHRPILMVLADHNEDGLYKIATFLINLKDYKLYFYLHDYCGNSAIFYAIPYERIINK